MLSNVSTVNVPHPSLINDPVNENPITVPDVELVDTAKKLTKKSTNAKIKVSGAAYYITRGDFFQSAMATMAQNDT